MVVGYYRDIQILLIILYFIEVKKYQMTAGKGGYDDEGAAGRGM